ncbi:DUF6193 family natural product biosynthesis protein [Streptomyces sp. NBC_00568]|uniref:DUF6193 family natural product biosynthesis protein n=1 Tax=Streptomyces sp. NBC_00568 TaxID=2975779 RepID=UPI002251DEB8|nr:DUF6193 family natural product biosynthesis protein [Streptomyces sp. NBC_00568]MCX4993395.1 DUF6193 family natural product biosynthesis protein [Streptomyces sp. NBC_00568]
MNLQDNGTRLACGWTADLAEAVRATAAWTGGAGLEETRARAPFIRFRPWALDHEREPFGVVELTWCAKLDRIHMPPYDRHPRPHAVLAAAYAQPVLRRLMPVNSHFNLWFSTSVEDIWKTRVGHIICPYDEGLYGVRNQGRLVARTETPEEAVAFVVAALPEEFGPQKSGRSQPCQVPVSEVRPWCQAAPVRIEDPKR